MPEVAAGLAAAAFTLLGMLAALFGLIGSSKPTIVKKTTVKTKTSTATEIAPVAPAGESEKQALDAAGVEVPAVKKRAGKA
jgi:calnexin